MKVLFLIILLLTSLSGFSQSKALKGNNQWLEQHLNSLVFKEGSENARFRFDDCDARMEVMAKGDNGFNMGMNFGCTLSQIEKVSYQKKGDAYLSFSLSTTDEKLMQEIKKRLETSIAACKSTVN
jgi:hypothetical protein